MHDTPPEGTPVPYDLKLGMKVLGAGAGAALFLSLVARLASDSLRHTQSLVFAVVLALVLSGIYVWLAARQPDAAKFIPPAMVAVLLLLVPQDFGEVRGNAEAKERLWNALPIYAAIIATSVTMGWLQWAPTLRRWAKKGAPATAQKSGTKKAPSGGRKSAPPRKSSSAPPAQSARPGAGKRPATRPPPPEREPEPEPEDEHEALTDDAEVPTEEGQVASDAPGVRKSAITTELPKLRKK